MINDPSSALASDSQLYMLSGNLLEQQGFGVADPQVALGKPQLCLSSSPGSREGWMEAVWPGARGFFKE